MAGTYISLKRALLLVRGTVTAVMFVAPPIVSSVHYFDEAATSHIPEMRTSLVDSFSLMI
jgi:hypothetical protein